MPDQTITTPPVAEQQPGSQTPPPNTPAPTNEDPFDKERAMATITKLREFEKQAKELSKKVAEYEAADKKRAEAEMTEAQKLKALADEQGKLAVDYKTRLEQAHQEVATLKLRGEVERQAIALGFQNPEDAYLLADMTGVEMDDDGKIKGVKESLEKLLTARPYLKKSDQSKPIGTPRQGQKQPQPIGNDKKPIMGIRL